MKTDIEKAVLKEWRAIVKQRANLRKLEAQNQPSGQTHLDYYAEHDKLKERLRQFLLLDFRCLNGDQMRSLCSMFGTFRPIALHSFFVSVALLIETPKSREDRTCERFNIPKV